ncbi:DegT/DnrJ/EryC1/StrS family aminotransferase [Pelagibius sp.]|uniref:DegT/DnrJ/EryC1/StrS family aminotransferase n=1 Tax=Pelagibius sp. TaxID=1931238 RepID=UPI003B5060EE
MAAVPDLSPLPPVPLVDLQKQLAVVGDAIQQRMAAVLQGGDFILGGAVGELEGRLADYAGVAQAITVANGTDALQIALMAMDVGAGDAVFVPPFTFAATAGAVVLTGATPVFVDIDDTTFTMDPLQLENKVAAVRAAGALTPRAVIPVDLFGRPADYPAIHAVAQAAGLQVLADAAQSFGAVQGDGQEARPVGSLAPMTTVSFYPSKPLGCFGDGGAILTDDPTLAERCRRLRGHGFDATGEARQVGMNSRLDSLQAAVLLAKLDVFDQELAARSQAAAWYDERLRDSLRTPESPPDGRSAWAVYSIRTRERERLRQALREAGIASAIYYAKPLHLHEAYAAFGDGAGSLPVSETASAEVLALPMHGYLDEPTVTRVCDTLLGALAKP